MSVVLSQGKGFLHRAEKTVTFTGAATLGAQGAVPLFTTTGQVLLKYIVGLCTTSLESAGGGTLALGVTGNTTLIIGATTAANITSTNKVWVNTTPLATGIALPAADREIVINANVIGTVATADVTAGVLTIVAYWVPLSSNGALS